MPARVRKFEEQELEAALTEHRRPSLPVNSWPGDAVYYEYLRWLDLHPEIEEWCSGNAENAARVLRLLRSVVSCVEKKLDGQDAETPSEESDQVGSSGTVFRAKENRRGLWGRLRQRLTSTKVERRRRIRNERELAQVCFQDCSSHVVEAAVDCGLLRELVEELGFSTFGWDLSTGELNQSVIQRLRSALAKLKRDKELREVLEDLGRLEKSIYSGSTSKFADFVEWVTQSRRVQRELIVPGVVMDVTGVEQSDELELMLPDEVAFLAHPQLRPVWFQRFADGQLATWKVQGTDIEQQNVRFEAQNQHPIPVRSGPIVALLDTSGSMSVGQREPMAKAAVLLLCQIAHNRNRRIFVISFSGPGQMLDFEFTPDAAGLCLLSAFLENSFSGGTDVEAPLKRSLKKCLQEPEWNTADVAIISDGYFDVSEETVQLVNDCREHQGLEVSALLIEGNAGACRKLCDETRIHDLPSWSSIR